MFLLFFGGRAEKHGLFLMWRGKICRDAKTCVSTWAIYTMASIRVLPLSWMGGSSPGVLFLLKQKEMR